MIERTPSQTRIQASVFPIAFILVLAIALIGVHAYQINYVPVSGVDAEIESNRNMLSDVREFDFAVQNARKTGEPQPVAIGSRIQYPATFPTPPPPEYIVSTTENETLKLENYTCTDGNCDNTLNSTTVIFLGDYNYLKNDSVYIYEYGMVYSSPSKSIEGDDSVITYQSQQVIQGDEIKLNAFQGNFTHKRQHTVFTTIKPNNAASRTFTIFGDGQPINITIPTELSEGRWRSMLEEEFVENGGYVEKVTYRNYSENYEDDGSSPGNANQAHWENCDHNGKGKPFVTCTTDNSTNSITFTLSPDKNYTVETTTMELNE